MNSAKLINADLAWRYNLIADLATLHGITEEGECPITAITVMLKNRHREQSSPKAMNNWKDKPNGDGYYWLRFLHGDMTIAEINGTEIWLIGLDVNYYLSDIAESSTFADSKWLKIDEPEEAHSDIKQKIQAKIKVAHKTSIDGDKDDYIDGLSDALKIIGGAGL